MGKDIEKARLRRFIVNMVLEVEMKTRDYGGTHCTEEWDRVVDRIMERFDVTLNVERNKALVEAEKVARSGVRKYNPEHGTCCTCAKCGLDHDSCICSENAIREEIANQIAKLQEGK